MDTFPDCIETPKNASCILFESGYDNNKITVLPETFILSSPQIQQMFLILSLIGDNYNFVSSCSIETDVRHLVLRFVIPHDLCQLPCLRQMRILPFYST